MPEAIRKNPSLAVLYAQFAQELFRIVAANVRAPDPLIEDACQAAWVALVVHRRSLAPGTELGWLATTATREALVLVRSARRDLSLEEEQEQQGEIVHVQFTPGPEHKVEVQERLAEVRRLPVRQQRLVMLHGFGYRYQEIAEFTGDSRRTVERQLLRAKRKLAG